MRFGGGRGEEDASEDFDEEFLGIASSEVEADCFEDESFETDYDLSWILKHLPSR